MGWDGMGWCWTEVGVVCSGVVCVWWDGAVGDGGGRCSCSQRSRCDGEEMGWDVMTCGHGGLGYDAARCDAVG